MNANDDDRTARPQVTMRLDRDLLEKIDDLARDEGVDRTELVRRLLADGLADRRTNAAIGDYAAGRRSAWSAAQTAGINLYEMLDRIEEAGMPYRLDPDVLNRLREDGGPRSPGKRRTRTARAGTTESDEASIAALRGQYRPSTTKVLLVGESSPAGGTHFYLGNSNLYRATRDAFRVGMSVAEPPEGGAFLAWFKDLGCWLVDLADHPVNRSSKSERASAVEAGEAALARTIGEVQPQRVIVVLRRIAPAVRRAARVASLDDRSIDVLPFPTRQWRPVYVDQLAGILRDVFAQGHESTIPVPEMSKSHRVTAESSISYGTPLLHDVIADVLRRHDNEWTKASAIAREIANSDLWRRPSDGRHPPASQVNARVRSSSYTDLFQTSDLGIRLRAS